MAYHKYISNATTTSILTTFQMGSAFNELPPDIFGRKFLFRQHA